MTNNISKKQLSFCISYVNIIQRTINEKEFESEGG